MSTRARIGIVNDDKTITSIYTHNDGYVGHHGPTLLGHYDAVGKVRALMALGDLSRLTPTLGKKHDFDTSYSEHKDWCCAYGRDRGEDSPACTSAGKRAFNTLREEYTYLFEDGQWSVVGGEIGSRWQKLTTAVAKERLTA